eukprot:1158797-Pelagomonas_calceolata.AAC.13
MPLLQGQVHGEKKHGIAASMPHGGRKHEIAAMPGGWQDEALTPGEEHHRQSCALRKDKEKNYVGNKNIPTTIKEKRALRGP